jgi:hypothetical protein
MRFSCFIFVLAVYSGVGVFFVVKLQFVFKRPTYYEEHEEHEKKDKSS